MRKLVSFILFSLIGFSSFAQTINSHSIGRTMRLIPESAVRSTQGIADYINARFSGESDKSRAIFLWIAKNIDYDIENMSLKTRWSNYPEVIDKTLKTRKGVCFDYAVLFNDIAQKVGLKSYLVSGYTKEKGIVDTLPHTWCAALIDAKWVLFDPTWGSGFVQHSKFIKQTNFLYCKARPESLIESHMPFDPLWQLLDYPVTNDLFYKNIFQANKKRPYFNFKDSIAVYDKQSDIERLVASNCRIEKNKFKNALILEQMENNRKAIGLILRKNFELQYNAAIESSNNGNTLLNRFIGYFNNKFIPARSDAEIQKMIDTVETSLNRSREKITGIQPPDETASLLIKQLTETIDKITSVMNVNKDFLKKYFSTRPESRIYLFYSWNNK